MIKAVKIINDLQNLFFPPTCLGCNNLITPNEKIICIKCRHQLPLAHSINENDNPTEKILYGRIKIINAASFVRYYKKGIVQQLIHQLKYKDRQEIGTFFGKWMGSELLNASRFKNIDMVIPVPLHPKKLKERGYNQVTQFGMEIAKYLDIPYSEDILSNTKYTSTQTHKNRASRNEYSENNFKINPNLKLHNKHILIVDDVITTGATLERCANAFSKDQNIKISIATIAITS